MTRNRLFGCLALTLGIGLMTATAQAENEGQEDLDKATELQIQVKSLGDMEKVAKLCEQALKKGLDEGNREFAEQLLSSTLFQHADRLSQPIFAQVPPDPRWPLLRQFALRDLERVIELVPEMGDAHVLIARLHALPNGDRERGQKAAAAAIKLYEDDPKQRAAALVIRAGLRDEVAARIEDYDRAIQLDPANPDAWQGRARTYMEQGQMEKAIADFNQMLEKDLDSTNTRLALAEALVNLEKYEEARKHIDAALKAEPDSSLAYMLSAQLHLIEEDAKAALADLDKAVQLNPQDVAALLMRARVHLSEEDLKAAKKDVDASLLMNPGLIQGILLRSMIAAEEGRLKDAIADIELLMQDDPENVGWKMQLGGYYIRDKRHSKAVDVFTKILSQDESNTIVRQARADTLLSMGQHREAIADFEILLKQTPEDDSVLNNFAWVLATSPTDELRNGQRAVKLATKACELTEYKEAHILSTLAAAYAEIADFETAVKWSKKAVELGVENDEIDEQLNNELKSYQQKKPWRESQTVEEKEDPVQPRRSQYEA